MILDSFLLNIADSFFSFIHRDYLKLWKSQTKKIHHTLGSVPPIESKVMYLREWDSIGHRLLLDTGWYFHTYLLFSGVVKVGDTAARPMH